MCKIIPQIKHLANHEGISIGALERTIGASKGVLSRAINNGTDIQSKWLQAIVENYPQYSAQWLLTGRGEMLNTNSNVYSLPKAASDIVSCGDHAKIASRHEIRELNVDLKPRIPFNASAGALSIADNGIYLKECEMLPVIPRFPKYDFTIVAKGDSMVPEIASGDELACRFISQRNFIQWGRTHVLDTAQGVVVKRIFEKSDSIVCRSVNTDYPDFLISKDDIYHIALVVGLIRQY